MTTTSSSVMTLARRKWLTDGSNDSIGIKGLKDGNTSYHLGSFLIKVLGVEESGNTNAISKSIFELDVLAQQIDKVIDKKRGSMTDSPVLGNFNNLETRIVDCFNHLSGSPELEKLISDTFVCVTKSFQYNTVDRHLIYNLKNTDCYGSTTYYLFPLIKYLFMVSQRELKNDRPLYLFSNYIQLLDDFIDVFDDIELGIKTPITERLNEIESNFEFSKKKAWFETLTFEIIKNLNLYYRDIKIEFGKLNNHSSNSIFWEWNNFHKELESIKVPRTLNLERQKEYLKALHGITPPIVCYTN